MAAAIQPDPRTMPLEPPPDGVISDFARRSDMLDLVIAILCIMFFLSTTILALRLWIRWGGREAWKLDDCMYTNSLWKLLLTE
jgi:hypothetical protein